MLHYYLLPGMGADHRLYGKLKLHYGEMHLMDWVAHEDAKDLTDYARIIARHIRTEHNVIIGSSMGGMVAAELTDIVSPLGTVLISAPRNRSEFPPILKLADFLGPHRAMGPKTLMKLNKVANTFMGFSTKEHEALFYEMLRGNGEDFLHFSVRAVLGWKHRPQLAGQVLQIIGERDRLFKEKRMQSPVIVRNSGHFLAYEQPETLARLINTWVEEKILPRIETK
jgi:pimeloyl-ACP methyl ester carboxylesterase